MGVVEIIGLIGGILKFWDSVIWLVKKLETTPEQDREKIMISIREEADKFNKTGRPTWNA